MKKQIGKKIISSSIAVCPTWAICHLLVQVDGWSIGFIAALVWAFVLSEKVISDSLFN